MKTSKNYIDDLYFLKWVFQPDALTQEHWMNYIQDHPEEKSTILSLKEELCALKLKNEDLSDGEKKLLFQRISGTIWESNK